MRGQKLNLALGIIIICIFILVFVPKAIAINQFPDPNRSFEIIVPFSVGSRPDTLARIFGSFFSDNSSRKVTINNLPGAIEAWSILSRAKPDGYTLGIFIDPYIKLLRKKNERTPSLDQFAPIAVFAKEEYILVTNLRMPFQSLKDLRNFTDLRNIRLAIIGLMDEFIATKLELKLNVQMKKKSINNFIMGLHALLENQVDLLIAPVQVVKPSILSENIRGLAVFSDKKLDSLPDVLPAVDQGIEILVSNNYGLMYPLNTSNDSIIFFRNSVQEFVNSDANRDRLERLGIQIYYMSGICQEGEIPCDDDCCEETE
jgi:tripartite-type tricarboxylate transporter receptor subunit TctC